MYIQDCLHMFVVKLKVLTTTCSMTWRLYKVRLTGEGPSAEEEIVSEVDLSEVPSASSVSLVLPKKSLEIDTYKAVFTYEVVVSCANLMHLFLQMMPSFQMDTGTDKIRVYQEAKTYFRVVPTPLVAIMISGAASKITRGWDQEVSMEPGIW